MVKTRHDKKLDNQSIINPETDVGHARCIKRYQPFRYAGYEGMRAPKINQTPDHPVRRWLNARPCVYSYVKIKAPFTQRQPIIILNTEGRVEEN